MEELRTIFSIIAIIISFGSIYYTRHFWLQSNRPIITAEIVENSSGVGIALFDLVISNSGNRPAINIMIQAEKADIEKIFSKNITETYKKAIYDIFSEKSKIALLSNGKETKTGFFSFSNTEKSDADILKYEEELPIKITYSDIEGRKFVSKINILTRASRGFGGGIWE
ncbi:hypothetical protein BGP_2240 [Beggiatoa sp. PS]|nr:hypothetical protein BGP_2240 [Beggiatoa sp. PS]